MVSSVTLARTTAPLFRLLVYSQQRQDNPFKCEFFVRLEGHPAFRGIVLFWRQRIWDKELSPMVDYPSIIKFFYPKAVVNALGEDNVQVTLLPLTDEPTKLHPVITKWELSEQKPAFEELDRLAQSQDYRNFLDQQQREEKELLEAEIRAFNLSRRIKSEREWLKNNWRDADPLVNRLMKLNEEILEVLFFLIRERKKPLD
jgi:hypothetical protein